MHLLSITDLNKKEIEELLRAAKILKTNPDQNSDRLKNKTLAMLFEKPSTRTRISFEVAMVQLGGHAINLNAGEIQLKRGEAVSDTAKVFGRYVDGVMARVYEHETLIELSKNSTIPVINGLSDLEHPCQIISDLFTIYEKFGNFDVKLAYVGDGNNVCNSLMLGCALMGINLMVATPKGYEPNREITKTAQKISGKIKITNDPKEAVKDADIVYTDVWVSMGSESEEEERLSKFKKYQINEKLLSNAKPGCKIMHCLPAHRGVEITDVIDGPNSIVWDQAENRLHAQKAVLLKLLE
jgi:ornithine carbamoyltransferase